MTPVPERYRRVSRYLGEDNAARLRRRTALIVGCGALGSAAAAYLARAGIGTLRLVDFDVVHETNLGDQALYLDRHAVSLTPKVEAAAEQLALINPTIAIEPSISMFDRESAARDVAGVDIIVDGADNLETKYLINDVAVATGTPWVYGGCVGRHGTVLAVVPGETPCLRCVWPEPPPLAGTGTCASIGLLPMTPGLVAALQTTAAIQILIGRSGELPGTLFVDVTAGTIRHLDAELGVGIRDDCRTCRMHRFDFLHGEATIAETGFCPLALAL
jgi:molybdopterin-synthase adenylyltransferase